MFVFFKFIMIFFKKFCSYDFNVFYVIKYLKFIINNYKEWEFDLKNWFKLYKYLEFK